MWSLSVRLSSANYISEDTSVHIATSQLRIGLCSCSTFEKHSAAESARLIMICCVISNGECLLEGMLKRHHCLCDYNTRRTWLFSKYAPCYLHLATNVLINKRSSSQSFSLPGQQNAFSVPMSNSLSEHIDTSATIALTSPDKSTRCIDTWFDGSCCACSRGMIEFLLI